MGLLAACGSAAAPAAPTAAPAAAAAPTSAPKAAAPTTAPAAAAPTTAPAAAAQPTTAAKPGQIEIVTHDWLQDPNDEFYGPFFKNFEAQHPTIKINRQWFPRNDMHTKELALAATGQIGDTCRINVAVLTPELQAKGVLRSLDEFINKDTAWKDTDQKQFWPGNIANYTIDGKQWGYPVVGHPGCIQHYMNLDIVRTLGTKIPEEASCFKWTIDDAVALYKAATKTGSDGRISQYGIISCLGGEGIVGVLRMFGGNYYDDDGKKALINTPESIAGLTWLADLFQKYKVEVPAEQKDADPSQLFPAKSVSIVVSTSFAASNFQKLVADKFKWTVLPPPIGPSGKFETQVSSDGFGMTKNSKHPDEAWEVVKAYGSKDHGLNRFLHGLGSPGSRYDIWTAPEFKQKVPDLSNHIYATMIDPAKAPPLRPWSHPANARYFETDTAYTNILQDVWLGKKKPADAAAEAQKAVQAIMDQPLP